MNLERLRRLAKGESLDAGDIFSLIAAASGSLNGDDRASTESLEISIRLLDAVKKGQVPSGCEQVIHMLAEECGLFPYLDGFDQGLIDQVVTEAHRVSLDKDIFLHAKQMEVLLTLLSGQSVILSGPTSFGKSLILDAFISKANPSSVAAILPTLALIDETRRRIMKNFPGYQVITTIDEDYDPNQKVFFALTQERFLQRKDIRRLDILFVDEFYKLDESRDDSRFEVLNLALYRGIPKSKQVFLAGPHISGINFGPRWRGRFNFIATDYKTVAVNIIDRSADGDRDQLLISDLGAVEEDSSLIFSASPPSAYRIAKMIQAAGITYQSGQTRLIATWLRENYHADWELADAVENGIGLHHGRVPRAIGQLLVKLFDLKILKVLICTSTLIEGVNTAAANVFIYDKKINRTDFDFFSFANIRGRVGRMMRHFVGNAFLYHSPPEETDTAIEIPIFSESGPSSDYLLVNLEDNDLSDKNIELKNNIIASTDIPLQVIRDHSYLGIDLLIELDEFIKEEIKSGSQLLWSGSPDGEEMRAVASIALFIANRRRQPTGLRTKKQVAWGWSQLMRGGPLRDFISWFAETFADGSPSGVDDCFQFLQACEFAFPRAISVGESLVNLRAGSGSANYAFFLYNLENWFRPAWMKTLDEMGVPIPLSERYSSEIEDNATKAHALMKLAEIGAGGRFGDLDGQLYDMAFGDGEWPRLDEGAKSN